MLAPNLLVDVIFSFVLKVYNLIKQNIQNTSKNYLSRFTDEELRLIIYFDNSLKILLQIQIIKKNNRKLPAVKWSFI